MSQKTDDRIKELQERQMMLKKQLDAKDIIIDTQDQQIRQLREEVIFLEEHSQKLSDGNRQLIEGNKNLEDICVKQQALLEDFIKMTT